MGWSSASKHYRRYPYSSSSGDEAPSLQKGSGTGAATNSDEACWRAINRISAASRWFKLDLAILAGGCKYNDIIMKLDELISMFGQALLPDLGHTPLPAALSRRPEVIDLINTLNSMPHVAHVAEKSDTCSSQTPGMVLSPSRLGVDAAVQSAQALSKLSKSAQTNGDYMVRFSDLRGEWIPLSGKSIRRGAVVKCVQPVSTDNAHDGHNVVMYENQLAKVINLDEDGDARFVLLSETGVGNLMTPSKRHWLLKNHFKHFQVQSPVLSEVELGVRHARDSRADEEDE